MSLLTGVACNVIFHAMISFMVTCETCLVVTGGLMLIWHLDICRRGYNVGRWAYIRYWQRWGVEWRLQIVSNMAVYRTSTAMIQMCCRDIQLRIKINIKITKSLSLDWYWTRQLSDIRGAQAFFFTKCQWNHNTNLEELGGNIVREIGIHKATILLTPWQQSCDVV